MILTMAQAITSAISAANLINNGRARATSPRVRPSSYCKPLPRALQPSRSWRPAASLCPQLSNSRYTQLVPWNADLRALGNNVAASTSHNPEDSQRVLVHERHGPYMNPAEDV
ncbi:hypothetical protein NE237_032588 [Protea cynaroides]|uniref:Uncharacterized protein n=1 Tax=Protea cynaroides TaxID=273540 RepID=A0A9Q0L491_9MAGN|nr:hypothetical protein NE237_032588 [Protea cynaroides]